MPPKVEPEVKKPESYRPEYRYRDSLDKPPTKEIKSTCWDKCPNGHDCARCGTNAKIEEVARMQSKEKEAATINLFG